MQDAIIAHTPGLGGAEEDLKALHETLMVMRLEGDEQMKQAQAALENCRSGICSILETDKLSAPKVELTFKGLGTFGKNKVLFAKLASDHETLLLKSVAKVVRESFASKGIFSLAKHDFIPHLTIMKTSRLKFKGRVIPKESYSDFHDQEFGKESMTQLQLCSMTHPWENGFYKVFGTLE